MGAVWFYHLTQTPLEKALPPLLTRALGQGWQVELRVTDPARAAWLDQALWLGPEDGFLPHGVAGGPHDVLQPVLLTVTPLGGRDCVVSVDGAPLATDEVPALARAMVMFDGNDPDAVAAARHQWRQVTGAGLGAAYWAQEDGTWVKKQERAG